MSWAAWGSAGLAPRHRHHHARCSPQQRHPFEILFRTAS
jgi:hypothetical protein